MRTLGGTLTSQSDKHTAAEGPVAADVPVTTDTTALLAAEQLVAQVRAARIQPRPFTGFVELAYVLLDVEIDGVRCILLETPPHRQVPPALSPRELEITRMVAKGLPNKSIAKVLQISTWTVSSHLRRVFAKLAVNSRAEMVARLLEEGYLPPPPRFDWDHTIHRAEVPHHLPRTQRAADLRTLGAAEQSR